MSAPALEARGLVKQFGALLATDNVSFAIAPGARQALIGPNGAGKTTLINLLTGVVKPIRGARPPRRARCDGARAASSACGSASRARSKSTSSFRI